MRTAQMRQERIVGSVTADGEVVEGMVAVLMPKRKNAFREGWFAMSNNAVAQLLTLTMEGKLQLRDLQTLYAMLEYLELENWIRVAQGDIGKRLNMAQPNVSRSVKVLMSHGIILQGPKIGTSRTYRLNPAFGWKGGAQQHQEAMKERMKAANIRGVVTAEMPAPPSRDPRTIDFINGKADAEAAHPPAP